YRGWQDRQQDAPDELTIIRRFGSWAAAVEAAGLAVEPRRPTWTADDVLDAIRRSRATAITEYQVWQRDTAGPSHQAIYRHFGSWPRARALAHQQEDTDA